MSSESSNFSSGSPNGMNSAGLAAAVVAAVASVLGLFKGWKLWKKGKATKDNTDIESNADREDTFTISGTPDSVRISRASNTRTNLTIQFISHPPMYPNNHRGYAASLPS
ncbi:uncharacterized protein LAJ45_09564 [Morchella importuna]|uniref:Uncharacterized protein n=1 Tax=Morchella conica CCBAS932 TaxID=1392247 RepID=A0A3N4KCQ0_9PEZI|nr:uncharacterized protein LAJ45_09564 [Morchella importuna]KAH8146371.1 hypothetical protein LAJ45_09564 [Morchella importuna]RPB08286.1 hypothetical protein P167DRAFT_578387 [Morchella conica CCBAS932]